MLQDFRNWFDLVWKMYAKDIKEIRKIEKRKEENKIKMKMKKGFRKPSGPDLEAAHSPPG
jgi:hypothetical protein